VRGRSPLARGGAIALALAAGLALGCSWDELTESGIRKAGEKPAEKAQPAGRTEARGSSAPRPSWWAEARSLSREDADPTITACRLGRSLRFMRADDCLAQGGAPAR
jgi:hypothetical protein